MAESFLEDQLRRIKAMSEQMSRAADRVARLADELRENRESHPQSPLQEVRDLRTYPPRSQSQTADSLGHGRRHTARDSFRRRR